MDTVCWCLPKHSGERTKGVIDQCRGEVTPVGIVLNRSQTEGPCKLYRWYGEDVFVPHNKRSPFQRETIEAEALTHEAL
jgi:hypothetical protein